MNGWIGKTGFVCIYKKEKWLPGQCVYWVFFYNNEKKLLVPQLTMVMMMMILTNKQTNNQYTERQTYSKKKNIIEFEVI